MQPRQLFYLFVFISVSLVIGLSQVWPKTIHFVWLLLPVIVVGFHDILQKRHTVLRLYPVVGHIRYLLESYRPEIQQYFVESDINGTPVSREYRSLVYQRAKGVRDTRPFGTVFDVYNDGYEWINHSLAPKDVNSIDSKVSFGGSDCKQPYLASPLNISAMSFGALSKTAIEALNKGAKIGGFAHNTGEGGLSPYHLKHGGDIIWQIGTGYFGCRDEKGNFNELLFTQKAGLDVVKMIEIKLSQGAKPGHGGILPAIKLTEEIAKIRHVPMGADVISPAAHTAFSTPKGLLEFVGKLRKLSSGKPVGFKLCIGKQSEFLAICKAMLETDITPDFITVDGSEGGTGAAPVELTNSVGMPLKDALVFVNNALIGVGLRDKIRIIASGKSLSSFHLLRLLALGADTVNAARAMMFALGCIQSRHCNTDKCPTGIATQDPARFKALDVDDKGKRVANYHEAIVENLHELLAAVGLCNANELSPEHIYQRVNGTNIKTYSELYPLVESGDFLDENKIPQEYKRLWNNTLAEQW
jgi:glutamate synthase domain-containing protein 2